MTVNRTGIALSDGLEERLADSAVDRVRSRALRSAAMIVVVLAILAMVAL